MKREMIKALALALVLGLGGVGCGNSSGADGGATGNNNGGGKADGDGGEFSCEVIDEDSGQKVDLSQRNDVIANTVLKSKGECPTTFAQIMDRMRETDADDSRCKFDVSKPEEGRRNGISAMIVSERSQLLKEPQGMRVVVTRRCQDRQQHDLFFSLFGVSVGGNLPDSAEVMSFDAVTGVYNYYALEGGEWTFFGTSLDLIKPGASNQKRCAGCHTGGGPIMKELDTPWVHWEGHEDIPGARDLVDKHDDLGTKTSGSTMESLVKSGNRSWNPTRVKALATNPDTTELLRPLFCTVEVNLDNGTDFRSTAMSRVPFDFLLDPTFKGFGGVNVTSADYEQALVDMDQRMLDFRGKDINDAEGNLLRDTIFKFVFPERAFADMNYVEELKKAGLVDDDFIEDVLAIDFTRPIYSADRCNLLRFAPVVELPADAAKIRDGFVANMEAEGVAEGSVEAQLLAHLKNATTDGKEHDEKINAFVSACEGRDKKEFMNDALMLAIQRRELAREFHERVFEFAETMPFAGVEVDHELFLHPETCDFNGPTEGGQDGE